eukprot:m.356717 g.356717  ORF g.356717 m.356717 type:complete len:104 (-) comp16606_c0_seq6:2913-3224(-)
MGFLDSVTSIVTVGQCNTSGCGGSHRDTKLGDNLANTATFGQCNGSGCGSGHTGTWAPYAAATGGNNPAPTPQQQQQLLQIAEVGLLVVGGIIAFNVLLDILL